MARLHQLQRHSRDILVFGRLESAPVDGPASRGVEPATASQRPDGGSPSNPGVGPVGSDGRPAGRAPRIMVVDDEPGIHLMARTTLEADGCEVIGATDGEAALEALRDTPVDLILLDLRMPLLDGLETLRHLRQIGDDTPVIIVTAYGTVPDAVEAMKLGAIDLLSKPLTPVDLRRVVSDVVERHAARGRGPGPRPAKGRTGPAAAVAQGRPAVDLTAVKVAMDRRDFDLATALLDRVIDTHPDAPEALALMGLLLERRGLDHAAYHEYRRAPAVDPTTSRRRPHATLLRPVRPRCRRPPDQPGCGAMTLGRVTRIPAMAQWTRPVDFEGGAAGRPRQATQRRPRVSRHPRRRQIPWSIRRMARRFPQTLDCFQPAAVFARFTRIIACMHMI